MRPRRARRAGLLAAGLVLGGSGLPGGLAAADVVPANLTGVVVLPDDRPVDGASVLVALLGPADQAAPDTYPSRIVGQAVTDAEGAFRIDLRPTREMVRQAVENDHYVNLEVFVTKVEEAAADAAGAVGGTATPVATPVLHGWDLVYGRLHETGATDPATEASGAVLSIPDPVTVELTAFSLADAAVTETGDLGTRNEYDGCGKFGPEVVVERRSAFHEPIGELHTYWDMRARIDYGQTANTDLGGALSIRKGPWKVSSGAAHMGQRRTTVGMSVGDHFGKVITSAFVYRFERLDFYGYGRRFCWSDHRIVPESWAGHSINYSQDTSHNDGGHHFGTARQKGFYGEWGPNSSWTKNVGRGYKYTWQANAFGVGLHAQSTWNGDLDIRYDFGPSTAAPHWLFAQDKGIREARTVYAY